MARSLVALVLCALIGGCGGPRMRSGELFRGRTEGPPSIECLPDPDVADEELSERMRRGLALAEESFTIGAPELPTSRAAVDLETWAAGPLREWIQRRVGAITAARRELDIAAEETHRQRIIGGAVVGLMYEGVALVLSEIPVPDDLQDEPEILQLYRQVVEGHARPFLETSRRAYHACAQNALQPSSMRHWSRFCEGRRDGLPGAEQVASGTTEVEVFADE